MTSSCFSRPFLLSSVLAVKMKVVQKCHCSWPGHAHNGRVYGLSPLAEELSELCYVEDRRLDETFHILGDSVYPLSNSLITPYRVRKQNMTLEHKEFNTHLASKRAVLREPLAFLA